MIIETGVARGGSVLFMASILEPIGKGKVIGVDMDIRAHNRDSVDTIPWRNGDPEDRSLEIDPVVNGKLVLSSSPGGYLRCRKEA